MSMFDLDPEHLHLVEPSADEFWIDIEGIVRLQFDVLTKHIMDGIMEGRDMTAPEEVARIRELLKNTDWLELLERNGNEYCGEE